MSKNIWFTSDTHYFHSNVIKYCNRPFSSVEEMNEIMIQKHNALVKPTDDIYHLGDFGFANVALLQSVFNRLNGNKFLLLGNHDKDAMKLPWAWVKERYELYTPRPNRKLYVLSHYAQKVWNKSHHGSIMLFGHSHGSLEDVDNQTLDVGVDCWDYAPVNLEQIHARLLTLPVRVTKDHHE